MTQDISIERFKQLAIAYGALRERWPEQALTVYDRFASMPEAQLILASAQQVDVFLNHWQPLVQDAQLRQRILDALPPQRAQHRLASHRWSLPAAIMMLFALLGFGNGYFAMDFSDPTGHDLPSAFGLAEEE